MVSNDHSQNGKQMLLHGQGRSILHTSPHPENLELPLSGDIFVRDGRLSPIFGPWKANGYDSQAGQVEDEGSPLPYPCTRSEQFDSKPVTSSPSAANSIIHSADEPQMSVTGGR